MNPKDGENDGSNDGYVVVVRPGPISGRRVSSAMCSIYFDYVLFDVCTRLKVAR